MTERQWLKEHFQGRQGRFLEIGAFDGLRSSITIDLLLYMDWHAVLVEPNPTNFVALLNNYIAYPRISLVHAAIAPVSGLGTFWDDGGGELSTLSVRHFAAFREKTSFKEYMTAMVTPAQLLEAFPGPFHLIVIDAEGMSDTIAGLLPWEDMPETEIVCIECDTDQDSLLHTLKDLYEVVYTQHPNIIFKRKSNDQAVGPQ